MADIEGKIKIKRGLINNNQDKTVSIGTPIIDVNSKELYISTKQDQQLKDCFIRVRNATYADNITPGNTINGTVHLGEHGSIDTIFSSKSSQVKDSVNVSATIKNRAISDIFDNIDSNNSVKNAVNVTTNINGHPINSIFENNGITVKNATNTVNAQNASLIVDKRSSNKKYSTVVMSQSEYDRITPEENVMYYLYK